jgi:uncharacterized protein (DUF1778 family)
MVEPKTRHIAESFATLRNTAVRDVLAIRLSAAEREQITAAATRLELTLSGFVRQSALQSSAVVEKRCR